MSKFDRYKRVLTEDFPVYLRARDKKSILRQSIELYRLMRLYRYLPYQYLKHALYSRQVGNEIFRYLPTELLHETRDRANADGDRGRLQDKLQMEDMLIGGGIAGTNTLFRLDREKLMDRDGNMVAFPDFLARVEAMNLPRGIIVKPRSGGSGAAVFKMAVEDGALVHEGETLDLSAFRMLVFTTRFGEFWDEFLIQETIVQHPDLDRFNPTSVNSVRIDSFIGDDGVTRFNAAALKIGPPGSVTDNSTGGGYMAGIDLETGKFSSDAKQEARYGGRYHDLEDLFGIDPQTFVIPFWDEVISTARKAAECMVPFRSLGWDIALSENGPLVIETNYDYGIDVLQEVARGYAEKPLGRAFLDRFPNRDAVLKALQ